MGGWGQYSLSPTKGAWVAQAFYLHWRYTMDAEFLAERAYPYCTEIAECLEASARAGRRRHAEAAAVHLAGDPRQLASSRG